MPTPFERQLSEGERIAQNVVKGDHIDSTQLARWIEGASERLLKQEAEIKSLRMNFYFFLFVFIGLPILLRGFG